jgi:hypothetical protein
MSTEIFSVAKRTVATTSKPSTSAISIGWVQVGVGKGIKKSCWEILLLQAEGLRYEQQVGRTSVLLDLF